MEELERFHTVVENRHEYAIEWKKKTGGRVFGFFGDYIPEELIYAAGILPVKIFGSRRDTNIAGANISPEKWCFFCRDCFAEALSGRYDYLDGIVISFCCFHLQQSFDSWVLHLPIQFHHYLDMPWYVQGKCSNEAFEKEIVSFKENLENFTGVPVTEGALREAIVVYNRNRQLMREIYATRKSSPPPISGTQAMEMVLASTFMNKEEHSTLLQELLAEIPKQPILDVSGEVRLMVIGAETEDTEAIRLAESLGAEVVIDLHSSGTKYFWNDISQNGDPLLSIATRYLEKIPLPQMDFPDYVTISYAVRFAREFNVMGAVMLLNPHCDPFQWEIPEMTKALEKVGIKVITVDLSLHEPSAVTRNRLEAFIEMLKAG